MISFRLMFDKWSEAGIYVMVQLTVVFDIWSQFPKQDSVDCYLQALCEHKPYQTAVPAAYCKCPSI